MKKSRGSQNDVELLDRALVALRRLDPSQRLYAQMTAHTSLVERLLELSVSYESDRVDDLSCKVADSCGAWDHLFQAYQTWYDRHLAQLCALRKVICEELGGSELIEKKVVHIKDANGALCAMELEGRESIPIDTVGVTSRGWLIVEDSRHLGYEPNAYLCTVCKTVFAHRILENRIAGVGFGEHEEDEEEEDIVDDENDQDIASLDADAKAT